MYNKYRSYQKIITIIILFFPAQKIYIDCDLGAEKKEVEGIFLAISDINKNYLETVQIYNRLVIGYNYWRNLFSTRWFKHILFIREKKSIK